MMKYKWYDHVNKQAVESDEPYTGCINNLIEKDEDRIATPSSYIVLCSYDDQIIIAVGPFVRREDANNWRNIQRDPAVNDYRIVELRDKIRWFHEGVREFEDPRQGM